MGAAVAEGRDTQDRGRASGTRSASGKEILPRIAVSLGDPNGIGPEIILKTLSTPELYDIIRPMVVGSVSVLRDHAKILGLDHVSFQNFDGENFGHEPNSIHVLEVGLEPEVEVQFAEERAEAGELALLAVQQVTDLCLEHKADAMVTAPLSKKAVSMAGHSFRGHTEFIRERSGSASCIMMMVSDQMKLGLVTDHISLSSVAESISVDAIGQKIADLASALNSDFGIESPSIAVLGLNPHAGEGDVLGHEESRILIPAIREAKSRGFSVDGPFPADGFFGTKAYHSYDAVLAMYHDQGLIPFKILAFDSGVNFTAGLPIVRTSPVHGTAFGIAGTGTASSVSMMRAFELAARIATRRKNVTV